VADGPNFVQVIIDGIPDPLLILDANFTVTAMNRAASNAKGDQQAQHGDDKCYTLMEKIGVTCDDPGRPCSLLTGKACRHSQERTSADGETYPVEIRMTPLLDESGEFVGAVELVHDLNDSEQIALKLRNAEEAAETASHAKSECVAMMSHEVRTPMNAVLGMVDLLQQTSLTRKQQDYVRTIQSSGNTLLSLVDNVLDFSELQASELVVNNRAFDIRQLVEHVLEIMGFQASSKGLELACRIEPDVPLQLLGDEDRIRQVMVNLINNAIRFTDSGEIVIGIKTDFDVDSGVMWTCSVTDTGVGIAPELRAKLFEPFVRDDRRESSRVHGIGLGLTICKWLIDGMRGSIKVDAELQQGTCVSFQLPLLEASATSSDLLPEHDLRGKRALVIHGNARMASIIGAYVTDWGMTCDAATESYDGLHRLQTGKPFDVIVIDATLSPMDGLSLARKIRAESSTSGLPIVLLTPIAFPLEVGQVSRIGEIRCVNKPVLPAELHYNLRKMIGGDELDRGAEDSASLDARATILPEDLRILIAEDNRLNRQLLQNMLGSLNLVADVVVDGPDVLEALSNNSYDLILMDCQMPGMDGEEVARRIRREPEKYRSQPVIVAVTADVSTQHRTRCLEAGMNDFIAKPLRRRRLLDGLHRWAAEAGDAQPQPLQEHVTAHLRDRSAGDDVFLSGYIELFVADTESRIQMLQDAAVREEWDTVRRQAHALKGACLEVGASAMGTQCDNVTRATDGGDLSMVPESLRQLAQEFERIQPILEARKQPR